MSLSADPPACTVPATGGSSTHKLVNAEAEKLVFKITSSNNNEYRITPVFGFVDPSGFTEFVVNRTAGAPKEDKLVIYFAPAPADATDAQAAFASVQPAGTITVPLFAKKSFVEIVEHKFRDSTGRVDSGIKLKLGNHQVKIDAFRRSTQIQLEVSHDESMNITWTGEKYYHITVETNVLGSGETGQINFDSSRENPRHSFSIDFVDHFDAITLVHKVTIVKMDQ